ncbi:MAG TPA: 4-(cytidine 5'-diphospho)-2-C-methyl-D-erythritol kinase [Actinomycetota bacterium]|nr:4-(cytidine 5'-diphospho)-2-C-methyl-D-erythritol kinase [Actinomycetota bacterium]
MKIKLIARAKINLSLHVVGPAPDDYHEIRTVMQSVDLADDLYMTRAAATKVEIAWAEGSGPLPNQPDLVERALALYDSMVGGTQGAEVNLSKRIPIGAGLGGGSADAAAGLMGMATLQGVDASGLLDEIAPQVGADVPFMLRGGCALAEGIGEKLTPLESAPHWWVIVVPSRPLRTAEVYQRFDELSGRGIDRTDDVLAVLAERNLERLGAVLSNDLEEPAFDLHPELADLKASVLGTGALGAVMCGSGSAIGGLFGSQTDAISAGSSLEKLGLRVFVTGSATRGIEVLDVG